MRVEARGAEASSPRPDRLSKREESMRIYAKDQVCSFRFSRAVWGAFSNFQPLAVPIVAGPWVFLSSEALYQTAKFAARPDVQQRIAEVPTAREAAAIGRTPGLGIDPGWNTQRVDVMRWVLRMKREANAPAGPSSRSRLTTSRGARGPSTSVTRATMSSDASGWSFASSFAPATRAPAPTPGSAASVSADWPPPTVRAPFLRPTDRRSAAGDVPPRRWLQTAESGAAIKPGRGRTPGGCPRRFPAIRTKSTRQASRPLRCVRWNPRTGMARSPYAVSLHICNSGYRNEGWMRIETIRLSTVLRLPSNTAFHSGRKPRKENMRWRQPETAATRRSRRR